MDPARTVHPAEPEPMPGGDAQPLVPPCLERTPKWDKVGLRGTPVFSVGAAPKTTQLPPQSFFGRTRKNRFYGLSLISEGAAAT